MPREHRHCHFLCLVFWVTGLTCLKSCLVASLTPAEIDTHFDEVLKGIRRAKHDEGCITPFEFKIMYKRFKAIDPKNTARREGAYNSLGELKYCDRTLFLECHKKRKRCECYSEGGYWVPDQPLVDASKNGKCYLAYMTPCSTFASAAPCGPGGICRPRERSSRPFCICKSKNEKHPSCVAYKKLNPKEEESKLLEKLLEKLKKRSMPIYGEPCIKLDPPIFSPRNDNLWKLQQVLADEEAAAPNAQRLRATCDFRKNLICVDNICKCHRRAEWDPVKRSCAGKFGEHCSFNYHGDFDEYQRNLSCVRPLKCTPLMPTPSDMAAEAIESNPDRPRPLGCCHHPNNRIKFKAVSSLGFEAVDEGTPETWAEFVCPNRWRSNRKVGAGSMSVHIKVGIFNYFLLRTLIAKRF